MMNFNFIPDLTIEDKKLCNRYLESIEDIDKKGSIIGYLPDFINEGMDKGIWYDYMRCAIKWEIGKTKYGEEPRKTCFYGPIDYTYSGRTVKGIPLNEAPIGVRYLVHKVNKITNKKHNSILCNFYRDGSDSIGFHRDNEKIFGEKPHITSLTFIETGIISNPRPFILKHGRTGRRIEYKLNNGTLLSMSGNLQKLWLHGMLKDFKHEFGRINLTFRIIEIKTP